MKKLFSVLLIAVLLCSSLLMTGCGLFDSPFDIVPSTYADSEKYTAGNAEFEGKVDICSVWWMYGNVTVKTHKENTVKIEESANGEIDEKFTVHWRYHNVSGYGDVLYVRFAASGKFDYGDLKKDITIYLPENEGMEIALNTEAASGEVDVSGFENTLEELYFCTNTGRFSAKIDSADEVRISGQNEDNVPAENREFILRASGTIYDLGVSSSYAKVDVAAKNVRSGEVGSVFADLVFEAEEARRMDLKNSEGKIYAKILEFDSLDIENRDAPCELTFSPSASFSLTIKEKNRFGQKISPDSVTVDFEGVTQSGSKYTVGSGESEITLATDSDVIIKPFAE